ncbi:hypothetical protein N7453_002514 [Penicillium expansum]|nr:hypothetical protein N7453_002514 [Penicillium expansum]
MHPQYPSSTLSLKVAAITGAYPHNAMLVACKQTLEVNMVPRFTSSCWKRDTKCTVVPSNYLTQ